MDKKNYYSIEYLFSFFDNRKDLSFLVNLNKSNLIAVPPEDVEENDWTKLNFNKCKICTLDENKNKHCPIAYNIFGLSKKFSSFYSIDKARIIVNVEERTYSKEDTVQQGLRSILGIYMATSGCPHMNILKPMARFHLPFASIDETIYRYLTTYLLGKFFEYIDGKRMKINLKELSKKFENIDKVNQGICKRIENMADRDAGKNALVILNALGMMMQLELKGKFESLKYLFSN